MNDLNFGFDHIQLYFSNSLAWRHRCTSIVNSYGELSLRFYMFQLLNFNSNIIGVPLQTIPSSRLNETLTSSQKRTVSVIDSRSTLKY